MADALKRFNFMARMTAELYQSPGGEDVPVVASAGTVYEPSTAFTSGTGSNQADTYAYAHDREMSGATSIDFELFDDAANNFTQASSGVNAIGNVHDMAEIVGFWIHNKSGAGILTVGAKGATGWAGVTHPFSANTHAIVLVPGSSIWMLCPTADLWTVADGTDILKFASSATLTFDFDLFGRSA
jgi:hypothetical protein